MPCPSMGPKLFWTVQIILIKYQLFWTCPIHFGQVQIIKISPEKSNLTLTKNALGPDQNNWYSTKMIWSVQNHFGAIEGQGTKQMKNLIESILFSGAQLARVLWVLQHSQFLDILEQWEKMGVINKNLINAQAPQQQNPNHASVFETVFFHFMKTRSFRLMSGSAILNHFGNKKYVTEERIKINKGGKLLNP